MVNENVYLCKSSKFQSNSSTANTGNTVRTLLVCHLFSSDYAAQHVGDVSRRGIEPMPPALRAWSPNHWIARDVPTYFLRN